MSQPWSSCSGRDGVLIEDVNHTLRKQSNDQPSSGLAAHFT